MVFLQTPNDTQWTYESYLLPGRWRNVCKGYRLHVKRPVIPNWLKALHSKSEMEYFTKLPISPIFKFLDWILYSCLCATSIFFMWQVLAQYQSKDSSFKEFEGPIDKSPTLVFCFHPFVKEEFIDQEAQKVNLSIDPYLEKYYMPYRLKVDFNIII